MKSFTLFRWALGFMLCAIVSSVWPQSDALQWSESPGQSTYKDPEAGCWRGSLEGYTDKMSVKQGETIAFKVSVLQPGQYTVDIHRIGATDEDMTGDPLYGTFDGVFEPLYDNSVPPVPIYPNNCAPPYATDHRNGCSWPTAFTVTIPTSWPSGFYYALLTNSSGTGRIPFVVKEDDPGSTSNILCVIAWNTYQAYNFWGGGSLYPWMGTYDTVFYGGYIPTISFQRPFGLLYSGGSGPQEQWVKFVDQIGQFHHREQQFISWAEAAAPDNYIMEYCIDFDLHDPDQGLALLNNYKLVIFPGHSEYWSRQQRSNVQGFKAGGGNLAFLAANNCYWRVEFQSSNTKIDCYKENQNYLWRRDPVEGPESKLIGIQFGGVNIYCNGTGLNGANIVTNDGASHWILNGTGLAPGSSVGLGHDYSQDDLNLDPLAAGEADMLTISDFLPANSDMTELASRKIRDLYAGGDPGYPDCPRDEHYEDPTFSSNALFSKVTYYEDKGSNARVFAAGGMGWGPCLYGDDANTMRIITKNILDHFSFRKYRGEIYSTLLTWGDEPLETETILDGNTHVRPGKTLSLTGNFLLTINSGVTLTVDGTLSIGSNVTITGGGKIVKGGSGQILITSNSSEATAFNGSRKIVRDGPGNYHVVFETEGEICYEKLNSNGELVGFRRLSASNGNNRYPCIAAKDNKIYVVWQRQSGGTYYILFRKSTDIGETWQAIPAPLASFTSSNPPLPVIASPGPSRLTVVYRTSSNLSSKTSTNDGQSWATNTVHSGSAFQSPSLAPTATYGGRYRSVLAYTNSSGTVCFRYYMNGTGGDDPVGWSLVRNLTLGIPGSYTNHQKPTIASSGTSTDTTLHVAWEAINDGSARVIIHRKATNIYTWPSVWSATYYTEQQQPSITGLANQTADLLWRMVTQNSIYRSHYDGSSWGGPGSVGPGNYPSVSIGNTNARFAYTEGASSPYQIKVSSYTLSKTDGDPDVLYHRSVAVLDTLSGAWFEFRLDNALIKTKSGEEMTLPFASAKEDAFTITPDQVFSNLATPLVTLPADAESLLVDCVFGWQDISAIKVNSNPLAVELALTSTGGSSVKVPAVNAVSSDQQQTKQRLKMDVSALSGLSVSLSTRATGVGNKSTLIASLGHIYEFTDKPATKEIAASGVQAPREFMLSAHPNPFNPMTQIHFALPRAGLAMVRIYNLNGQMIRELVNGDREAGEYNVIWDSRNDEGNLAASGVYFIRFEAGEVARLSKITLVR